MSGYTTSVLPLLPLRPVAGFLVLTATLPLYYAAFHFMAVDQYAFYRDYLVWLIWLPAWVLLDILHAMVRRVFTMWVYRGEKPTGLTGQADMLFEKIWRAVMNPAKDGLQAL